MFGQIYQNLKPRHREPLSRGGLEANVGQREAVERVLTRIETEMPPLQALYVFRLATGLTTEQVAEEYRVSHQAISQALKKAREVGRELAESDNRFADDVRAIGFIDFFRN